MDWKSNSLGRKCFAGICNQALLIAISSALQHAEFLEPVPNCHPISYFNQHNFYWERISLKLVNMKTTYTVKSTASVKPRSHNVLLWACNWRTSDRYHSTQSSLCQIRSPCDGMKIWRCEIKNQTMIVVRVRIQWDFQKYLLWKCSCHQTVKPIMDFLMQATPCK